MKLSEFVEDDDLNDDLGELLDRFAKVDEIASRYGRDYKGCAEVSNEACELLLEMQKAAIKMVVRRWEFLHERKVEE